MVRNSLVLLVAGSLCLSATSFAQETPKPKHRATQEVKQEVGKKVEAAKEGAPAQHVAATRVEIPLAGVTKDNVAAVKAALEGLQRQEYACDGCSTVAQKAGNCPSCNEPLKERTARVLQEVNVLPDSGMASFRIAPGAQVGLTQMDAALRAQSAHVNRDHLVLHGGAEVVLGGLKSASDVGAVDKALADAKLASGAKVELSAADAHQAILRLDPTAAPLSLSALSGLAKTTSASWSVADVVWTAKAAGKEHAKG